MRLLPCSHYFHVKCIDEWFFKAQKQKPRTCPLCNANPLGPADTLLGAAVTVN